MDGLDVVLCLVMECFGDWIIVNGIVEFKEWIVQVVVVGCLVIIFDDVVFECCC